MPPSLHFPMQSISTPQHPGKTLVPREVGTLGKKYLPALSRHEEALFFCSSLGISTCLGKLRETGNYKCGSLWPGRDNIPTVFKFFLLYPPIRKISFSQTSAVSMLLHVLASMALSSLPTRVSCFVPNIVCKSTKKQVTVCRVPLFTGTACPQSALTSNSWIQLTHSHIWVSEQHKHITVLSTPCCCPHCLGVLL